MDEQERLAQRFDADRPRLTALAHRMLGSPGEADAAVREARSRLRHSAGAGDGTGGDLSGWLTTVVGRVCLDVLRARRSRPPGPVDVRSADGPGQHAPPADSVTLALLVVLESLAPAERLALVLHDLFALPHPEIARLAGRTPPAARRLTEQARRRIRGGAAPVTDTGPDRQREVVDAFLTAVREGDHDAVTALLAPDVVARSDTGPTTAPRAVHGAAPVARASAVLAPLAHSSGLALVDGAVGMVATHHDRFQVLAFTIAHGRIHELDLITAPARLRALDLAFLR